MYCNVCNKYRKSKKTEISYIKETLSDSCLDALVLDLLISC